MIDRWWKIVKYRVRVFRRGTAESGRWQTKKGDNWKCKILIVKDFGPTLFKIMNKHRLCDRDSNPGPQEKEDGRRKRIIWDCKKEIDISLDRKYDWEGSRYLVFLPCNLTFKTLHTYLYFEFRPKNTDVWNALKPKICFIKMIWVITTYRKADWIAWLSHHSHPRFNQLCWRKVLSKRDVVKSGINLTWLH